MHRKANDNKNRISAMSRQTQVIVGCQMRICDDASFEPSESGFKGIQRD